MNQSNLEKTFGERLITLNAGKQGLRKASVCAVKAVAGAEPVIEFIGSDETVDRYGEVIQQAGWQLDEFRANPVIPDCHDYSSVLKILGRADSVAVVNNQLVNRVRFALDNPLGNIAYKMAKGGFIKSQSVGFIPLEWVNGKNASEPERTFTKCALLEISLVVVPANPGATIGLALKQGVVARADLRELADYLKQFCDDGKDSKPPGGAPGLEINSARSWQLLSEIRKQLTK